MIFSAISLLRLKKCSNSSRTVFTSSERISVLPSLFLVCDSKTGSFSRIATAPTMHSRTSSPSNFPLRVFVHRLEQAFAEGAQVRAAVAGVLAVDEGIKRFAVAAVAVGETKLQRLARVMQRRINRLAVIGLQILHHQIQQAVARLKGLAVEDQLQPGVQVAVMAQAALDVLRAGIRLP